MKKQTILVVTIALLIVVLFALPVTTGVVGGNYSMADLEQIQDALSEGDYSGIVSTHIDQMQMKLVVHLNNSNPVSYWSAARLFLTYGGAVAFVFGDLQATPT